MRLLTCDDGWKVSLEAFEDVGAESAEGVKVAEQIKSTFSGNPVSDRSIELWKTFANWVVAVENGELIPDKTKFEIYVSQPKTGEIVKSFSEATSENKTRQALAAAKSKLWGTAPLYEEKEQVAKGLAPYLNAVFSADEDIICAIIQSFHLSSGSGSAQDDLQALFAKTVIPMEILDEAISFSIGWVKKKTDSLIEQRQPAIVAVDDFRTSLRLFVRKHDRRTILSSFAKKPSQEQVDAGLNFSTYVAQLTLIDCDEEEKIEAVTNYLLASADRTQWSAKGLIDSDSFDDLENNLIMAWKNIKTATEIEHSGLEETKRGQLLLSKCCLFRAPLVGLEVPSYFIPGSFHALADGLTVGWHPNYRTLLDQKKKA